VTIVGRQSDLEQATLPGGERCFPVVSPEVRDLDNAFDTCPCLESYTVPLADAREANDGAVAREGAIRGYGIAMKSMWDIGADVRAGRLNILLPQWRSADAPVHATAFGRTRTS